MAEEPKVCIMMTTYNGGKYLRAQLDSFAKQTYKNLVVVASDDGSTDDTFDILEEYKKQLEIIVVKNPKNHGACGNFLNAMKNAPKADYYAFADQDDVWAKEKIETLVSDLAGVSGPALVYCDAEITDGDLKPSGRTFVRDNNYYLKPGEELKQLLVSNYIQGCAMLFNRALFEKIDANIDPTSIAMHDWWIAQCAAIYGEIRFEEKCLQFYRQHGNNVLGEGDNDLKKMGHIGKVKAQWQKDNDYSVKQAEQLLKLDADKSKLAIVKNYLDIVKNTRGIKRISTLNKAGFKTIKKISMLRYI